MTSYLYPGRELDLFENARKWKEYWRSLVSPYLRGEVLEVGSGIGANTRLLSLLEFDHWVCLEPDAQLFERLMTGLLPSGRHELVCGFIDSMDKGRRFDAILYLDVLEHVLDDRAELIRAATLLKPNGVLIVLAPAHQCLASSFDKAIGHYRRYTRASLCRVAPSILALERSVYLDSFGAMLLLANRCFRKTSFPSETQIKFWDQFLVPCSKAIDRVLRFTVGKSILCVWRLVQT